MKRHQTGLVTVELAMVGGMFFFVLLGVLETGRAMFTMNALNEATRLGARAAAVCPVQNAAITNIARFNDSGVLSDLEPSNIVINYLDEDGGVIANPSPANVNGYLDIRFVQVSIQDYEYEVLVPGVPTFNLPTYTTTLPRQSLGVVPSEATGC